MEPLHEMRTIVERRGAEGPTATSVDGLTLYLETDPGVATYVVSRPVLALVVGGGKRTVLGGRVFQVSAGDCVAVSVELPASGQVTEPPYAAVTLDLDPNVLASLMTDAAPGPRAVAGVEVHRAGPELLDAMLRLVRLLDRPQDAPVLAPLIQKEVFWRLLQSPSGPMVRQIVLADSQLARVNRAIIWLRANFAEPARIEQLAALAGTHS